VGWVVGFADVVSIVAPMGIAAMGASSLHACFSYTSLSISISISLN